MLVQFQLRTAIHLRNSMTDAIIAIFVLLAHARNIDWRGLPDA